MSEVFALHVSAPADEVPLVVDLDGTLVRTDTLHESLLLLLKRNPLAAIALPFWLLRGKAHLKQELARRVLPDPATLPYHEELLDLLRTEKARGRRLVLATAADARIARNVAEHLAIFDDVLASDGTSNLVGAAKLERIRSAMDSFDYAGNDASDLPLWRESRAALVVGASAAVARRCRKINSSVRIVPAPRAGMRTWLRAIRVHQWAKNVLIFAPMLAAHRIREPSILALASIAFASFCLCASSVYLLNDLLDLENDRRHPTKRNRPLAAGLLSVRSAIVLALVLLLLAAAAASVLPSEFQLLLATYYGATLAYSLFLKQVVVLDVLLLASLYTGRIIGGSLATGIPLSSWLLMFAMFLFQSLALVKRLSEIWKIREANRGRTHGRGYVVEDFGQVVGLGSASGYLSVLILALYISNAEVAKLYAQPERLWALCPILLYWIGRIWILANRGMVDDDPLVFALKDRVSQVVALITFAVVWSAT